MAADGVVFVGEEVELPELGCYVCVGGEEEAVVAVGEGGGEVYSGFCPCIPGV